MGLKKSFTSKYGLTAPDAYHRIQSVRGTQDGFNIRYEVETYYDQDARDAGHSPLEIQRYSVPNALKTKIGIVHELYEVLKAETEYDGAIDIFEPSYFPNYSNQPLVTGYVLSATLADGYSIVNDAVTDAILSGKCLVGGEVIIGSFTQVDAQNLTVDGYGVIKGGCISDGYADGYVVQVLI